MTDVDSTLLADTDCQLSVMRFHKPMLIPIGTFPNVLAPDRLKLRIALIKEEWEELLEASGFDHATDQFTGRQDIIEMADALGDIVVVCFGMAIEMGVDLNAVFREIMRANMSKLDENGNPLINSPTCGHPECVNPMCLIDPTQPKNKVLKASGYKPPEISRVLGEQGPLDDIYSV